MPPNLEGPVQEEVTLDDDIPIVLTPISDVSSSSSELNFNEEPIQDGDIDVLLLPEETVHIPLEQNLKELLMKATDTEDLSTVTQIKLRVISREVTLQYLSVYAPALRELVLDGSVVTSLRDIGGGLKNLKILRVNRCGLTCVDGVFSLEHLEALYVADNAITSLAPCVFLTDVRVLDVRRNLISDVNLRYLSLCQNLEELSVDGNPGMDCHSNYREMIQLLLPTIKKIDGEDTGGTIFPIEHSQRNNGNVVAGNQNRNGFSINFPPRVFFLKYQTHK